MAEPTIIKLTKEQLVSEFKALGQEQFDIRISVQAQDMLSKFPNFPLAHFKQWYINKYMLVTGGSILRYINAEDGLIAGQSK